MIERFRNMRPVFKPLLIIGGVILAGVFALLFGLFIMLLWNWLMPAIFSLPKITYWQGWGIAVLAHLLFKAGSGGHKNGRHDSNSRNRDNTWKKHFRENIKQQFEAESEEGDPETI